MASVIILGMLAGILGGNGLPHFVKGITGQRYMTPFGDVDSPTANVLWGWLCGVVAVLAWHIAPMRFHPRAAFVAVSAGVLVVGLLMSEAAEKAKTHSQNHAKKKA